jgi:hypothetical protein
MRARSFISRSRLIFSGIVMLLALVFSPQLRAQNYIGFYPPVLIGLPDTVSTGDSITAAAVLGNLSPFVYNDTLTFSGYVDTGNGTIPFLFVTYPQVTLNAFDTIPFIFQFPIRDVNQQGSFRIGGNVIVIWPIVSDPQFTTGDSIVVPIFVLDGTSIGERPRTRPLGIKCFPIPTRQQLTIEVLPGHPSPENIVVRDIQARIVYQNPWTNQPINVAEWEPGIYILECRYEDGSSSYTRIIR